MARTEAAFMRNEALIAAYRKAGYHSKWKSAAGCCRICTLLNGQTITTLKPPLHKSCGCTVSRGDLIQRTIPDKISVDGVEYPTNMNAVKQSEHILGTPAYVNRQKQRLQANKVPQSAFYNTIDVNSLVREQMGKHNPIRYQDGSVQEYFDVSYPVGVCYENDVPDHENESTRVCIRYNVKTGWHAYPVMSRK